MIGARFFSAAEAQGDVRPALRTGIDVERRRRFALMEAAVQRLTDDVARYAALYPRLARRLVTDYLFCILGIQLSEGSKARKAELICQLSETFLGVIAPAPLWQVWNWKRSVADALALPKLIAAVHAAHDEPVAVRSWI